jgi:hypothetical protein
MNTFQDIQAAILQLPKQELRSLKEWLDEIDAEEWDKQFAQDVAAGKLHKLGQQAVANFRSGKCKAL